MQRRFSRGTRVARVRAGVAAAVITTLAAGTLAHGAPAATTAAGGTPTIRGMYLQDSTVQKQPFANLGDLARLKSDGVNTIPLFVFLRTKSIHGTTVERSPDQMPDAALISTIRAIHAAGLSVNLVPYVRIYGPADWRGRLAPRSPAAWFDSYRAHLRPFEKIAKQTGVEFFTIGQELQWLQQNQFRNEWARVVYEAREQANFHGKLIYQSSSGGNSFENITWWDLVDIMGVSAYYSLSTQPNPSIYSLVNTWRTAYFPMFRAMSAKYHKKVLFGEIGYVANSLTAYKPATIWQSNQGTFSLTAQSNAYAALLEATKWESWYAGTQFFHWDVPSYPGFKNTYQPRDRPAECVLMRYWSAPNAATSSVRKLCEQVIGRRLNYPAR